MENNQNFDDWIEVKKEIHASNRVQAMKDGEIWWCAMGENVGGRNKWQKYYFCTAGIDFQEVESVWLSRYTFNF